MKPIANYFSDLYELRKKYGQMVSNEIIIPMCEKYQLSFICSMGTYVFVRTNKTKLPKAWFYYDNLDEDRIPESNPIKKKLSLIKEWFSENVDLINEYNPQK